MSSPVSANYGNGGADAYVANERLAAEDAARRAWLDRACKAEKSAPAKFCRHCQGRLAHNNTSGICGNSRCYRADAAVKAGKPAPRVTRPAAARPKWPRVVAGLQVPELRRLGELVLRELARRGAG